MRYFASIIFAVALCLNGAAAEELTSSEIVARAVERQEKQDDSPLARSYTVELVSTREKLDGDGATTETVVSRYRRYPLAGGVYDELIQKDGKPLDEAEKKKEADKKAKYIREQKAKAGSGEARDGEDDGAGPKFDKELTRRYRSELAGEETVRGHSCWIVRFWPRAGDLPNNKRIDAALNKSSGRLWISQEDYGLARVEFHLDEPVKFWGGLLGNLRGTDGRVELGRTEEGAWFPIRFDLRLDLRVLVRNIRQKVHIDWDEYQHTPVD